MPISLIGHHKISNQDTFPHSAIETIQYRYLPHHIEPESPFLLHILICNEPIVMVLIYQISHQIFAKITLIIPTQKSINHHLSTNPRHHIIHHQVITSMRGIWSPRPPISILVNLGGGILMSPQSPEIGPGLLPGGGEKKVVQFHEQFFSSAPSLPPGKVR